MKFPSPPLHSTLYISFVNLYILMCLLVQRFTRLTAAHIGTASLTSCCGTYLVQRLSRTAPPAFSALSAACALHLACACHFCVSPLLPLVCSFVANAIRRTKLSYLHQYSSSPRSVCVHSFHLCNFFPRPAISFGSVRLTASFPHFSACATAIAFGTTRLCYHSNTNVYT